MIRLIKKIGWIIIILIVGLSFSVSITKFISKTKRLSRRVKVLEGLCSRVARLEYLVRSYHFEAEKSSVGYHAPLNDYYYESFDDGIGKWETWFQPTHFDNGGYRNGFMRFSTPCKVNLFSHPKVGIIHIVNWLYVSPIDLYKNTAFLGEGDPDFRGAKVSFYLRGNNFKANGAELFWLSEAQSNIEVLHNKGWRRANWIYMDFPLTEYLLDGKWHKVEFTLVNDSSKWLELGNNPAEGNISKRYEFWSLDNVLAHHNISFDFILAYVDKENPSTGSIDFDEFEIHYHNKAIKQ